jgi:hypothetical protein
MAGWLFEGEEENGDAGEPGCIFQASMKIL